jgi:hypothetical protein
MAYDYFGASVFDTVIRMLNDGESVTKETLYRMCLEPLANRTTWLREELARSSGRLAAVSNGTRATVLGTKSLSTFSIYNEENNPEGELGPGGKLDGRTLILDEDTSAGETVTFFAPMSAAQVAAQIAAMAPTNKAVLLDDNARLVLMSNTVGASSSLIVTGSAAALLGLPSGEAVGKGTVDDGASRIGFYQHGAVATGTVRSALVSMIDAIATLFTTKAALSGDTFTGPVTFNELVTLKAGFADVSFQRAPDADATIKPADGNLVFLPYLKTGSRKYLIAEPGKGPRRIRVLNFISSPYGAIIGRASDGSLLAGFPAAGSAWIELAYLEDGTGEKWRPIAWGGNVSGVNWQ